jgi:D-sedoheptulose 7-phosphate isomerase
MEYIRKYLDEAAEIIDKIDKSQIRKIIDHLKTIRERKGRIFSIGIGGGAANSSHAVNDFRKICGLEAYTPLDNISEFSARANDEGWDQVFVNWLKGSHLSEKDGIFVFSVGGGDKEKNISANIVEAVKYAREIGAEVLGVVGRDGGYTAQHATACLVVPPINTDTVTPHTESFQAVVWHLIISHPEMKINEMKWESTKT